MQDRILRDRVIFVTGATHGFGREVSMHLYALGANLIITSRHKSDLENLRKAISPYGDSNQIILSSEFDVGVHAECVDAVNNVLSDVGVCDGLVNNAGVYGSMGNFSGSSIEEWVEAINVNFLGSVYMTHALLPHFINQNYGKIVQLSGGGATSPMPNLSSYAASKAAIVRFMESIALEVVENKVDINCIAPGALNTRLLDQVIESGPKKVGQAFYEKSVSQKLDGGAPTQHGIDLTAFLLSKFSDGISGKLISALWDDWKTFPRYLNELRNSDVFTLRRIVGKERGFAELDL